MVKIMLAVGNVPFEEALTDRLKQKREVVYAVDRLDSIIHSLQSHAADEILIAERIKGSGDILQIVYQIRKNFPKMRIVFIAGDRSPGDALLAQIVNYGIYDVVYGRDHTINDIVGLILNPLSHEDVMHLQPLAKLGKGDVIFEAPDVPVVQQIVNVDYGEGEGPAKPASGTPAGTTTPPPQPAPPVHPDDTVPPPIIEQKAAKKIKIPLTGFFGKKDAGEDASSQDPDQEDSSPAPKKKERFTGKKRGRQVMFKQKIVGFVGSRMGVGNTTTAFNTASLLASNGHPVLYIELDWMFPSIAHILQLDASGKGIDFLLKQSREDAISLYSEIPNNLFCLKDYKDGDHPHLKKIPDSLDILTFSHNIGNIDAMFQNSEDYNTNIFIEVIRYLYMRASYDFIIVDIPPYFQYPIVTNTLLTVHDLIYVITQDICSVGYYGYYLDFLTKSKMISSPVKKVIVNQFMDGVHPNKGEIYDWIGSREVITIPSKPSEFTNANYHGVPAVFHSKDSGITNAFESIINSVYE